MTPILRRRKSLFLTPRKPHLPKVACVVVDLLHYIERARVPARAFRYFIYSEYIEN
jgi:hypothetical protein